MHRFCFPIYLSKSYSNNWSSLIRDTFPPSSAIFTCILYLRNISSITRTMCQAIIPPNTNLSIGNASNLLLLYFTHPLLKRMKAFELTDIRLLAWPNIYICPYTHVSKRKHVIYPFPPRERHGVSVYEAVSACSLTAYKFPWSPFGITTRPLLNNPPFT